MASLKRILNLLLHNPAKFFDSVVCHCLYWLPDKPYLSLRYRCHLGHWLNWENPKRYTEKLQWLKLHDRNPLYTKLVDKYEVKNYIASLIGEQYIIPTLGVWSRPEDIEWDILPNSFVLKTTHGGGGSGIVICKNKNTLNIEEATRVLKHSMNADIYKSLREWPYKNVPHRIIAEKYMEDDSGELRDYKFYCFNGEPKAMLIASNRFSDHNFNYFDMDFNKMPIVSNYGKESTEKFVEPENFESMKAIARKLSAGIPHVRVDLYNSNHQIYFGELTFFDASGYDNMSSDEWDLKFGSWIKLPV